VVHENKNRKPTGSSIFDPGVCIHRNGTGGTQQGQRSGDTGGECPARRAGDSNFGGAASVDS